MKKALSVISTGCTYFFGALLFLAFLPLIIPIVLFMLASGSYVALWSWVRHDPKRNIEIQDLVDETWHKVKTEAGFVKAFERFSDKLAHLSGAKQEKIICEGFDILEHKPSKLDWTEFTITQILKTKHAEVALSLVIGAYISEDGQLHVELPSSDDHDESSWPPATARIIAPSLHVERHFTLRSSQSVWAVIGLLRGEATYAQPSGQLWIRIPEHDVWMVQYKINGDDYGLRKNFSHSLARQYGRDQSFVLPSGT